MMKTEIFINCYVVPLIAVLLSIGGLIQGGTGIIGIDMIVYFISLLLCYCMIYFFMNYEKNHSIKICSISIYFLLIILYSIALNTYLIIPLLLLFGHLFLLTTRKVKEIDLSKSTLSFAVKNLPKTHKKILVFYFAVSALIVLFIK